MNNQISLAELELRIELDSDPPNPREWDNLGTMACAHRRYNLGDIQPDPAKWDYLRSDPDIQAGVVLPLYLYDHSGITMSTAPFSCPWDSGQVGIIFCRRSDILQEFGRRRLSSKLLKKVKDMLQNEVKEYDDYLTGNVYGWSVVESTGAVVDSCWGYYGRDYCQQEGQSVLDHWIRVNFITWMSEFFPMLEDDIELDSGQIGQCFLIGGDTG